MIRSTSSYLLRQRRSLHQACHDRHAARGSGAPACGVCPLADICARERSRREPPKSRPVVRRAAAATRRAA